MMQQLIWKKKKMFEKRRKWWNKMKQLEKQEYIFRVYLCAVYALTTIHHSWLSEINKCQCVSVFYIVSACFCRTTRAKLEQFVDVHQDLCNVFKKGSSISKERHTLCWFYWVLFNLWCRSEARKKRDWV